MLAQIVSHRCRSLHAEVVAVSVEPYFESSGTKGSKKMTIRKNGMFSKRISRYFYIDADGVGSPVKSQQFLTEYDREQWSKSSTCRRWSMKETFPP